MRIGILRSGLMGSKLRFLFSRAGHDVVFSYARSDHKLERLARDVQYDVARRHPRSSRRSGVSPTNTAARSPVENQLRR
jgi:8-hydroxy-5-deazaflavin:NADPH oxidoreductase